MSNTEPYFKNNELAYDVWKSKYQFNDETLDQFFERLAKEFTRLDNFKNAKGLSQEKLRDLSPYGLTRSGFSTYDTFLNLFKDFKYIIPGGSVLAGLGSGKPVSLSNCFVLDVEDSIESIFNTASNMSQIYKRRGGVGIDLSVIRPRGAVVNNAAKTTSGVVPFMELFSQVTNTIGQDGRRGALMLSIDINHPDSPEFIKIKQDLSKVTGANISVKLNNEFKKAVENDEDYFLRWPVEHKFSFEIFCELPNYDLHVKELNYNEVCNVSNTEKGPIYAKRIKAKELWDSIIQCAWNTAEPGILFWQNIIDNDPASVYPEFKAVSTNPCGEIPLSPYDSCRLIATNVFSLIDNPFTSLAAINEYFAYQVFYEAQIIGDILVDLEAEYVQNIIDKTESREKELWINIKEIGLKGRRTGVGILGLGDMYAALGVPYGSKEETQYIMKLKMVAELDATIDLAIINGAFPAYNSNLEWGIDQNEGQNNFYAFIVNQFPAQIDRMKLWGRRNISWSTIAPTGSISILAETSSGCEPVFSIYYTRKKKCNPGETPTFIDQNGIGFIEYNVIHPKFIDWFIIEAQCKHCPEVALKELDRASKEELEKVITKSPWYKETASDISYYTRVSTQSILQQYTTHSISSTVNVANGITVEYIDSIYRNAWDSNLKGITVYRDQCRSGILTKESSIDKTTTTLRPTELECKVEHFKNEKKDWVAFVGILNSKPYEVFTGPKDLDVFPIPASVDKGFIIKVRQDDGVARYDFRYIDSYGYTNTLGGLSRIFDKEFWNYARFVSALLRTETPVDQIVKVVEGLSFTNKGMNNWKSGVIRSLKMFIADGTKVHGEICENCNGTNVIYESGCKVCRDCGISKCG